jgi:hemerythrin
VNKQNFIDWSDEYLVGHEQIDYQHQRLFDMINQLYQEKDQTPDMSMLVEIFLEQLIQYTDFHFSIEEQYMREIKYADYDGHKKIHDHLRGKVIDLKNAFMAGRAKLDDSVFEFLRDWLVEHIGKKDKALAKSLNK